MSNYLYGFNPSGGVHRYDQDTGVFEIFLLDSLSWDVLDFERYRGFIDWRNLADMPAEVREVECASWVIDEPAVSTW